MCASISMGNLVDTSKPGDAHMWQWTKLSLAWVTASHLHYVMKTSSRETAFRIICPLWRETMGDLWNPITEG